MNKNKNVSLICTVLIASVFACGANAYTLRAEGRGFTNLDYITEEITGSSDNFEDLRTAKVNQPHDPSFGAIATRSSVLATAGAIDRGAPSSRARSLNQLIRINDFGTYAAGNEFVTLFFHFDVSYDLEVQRLDGRRDQGIARIDFDIALSTIGDSADASGGATLRKIFDRNKTLALTGFLTGEAEEDNLQAHTVLALDVRTDSPEVEFSLTASAFATDVLRGFGLAAGTLSLALDSPLVTTADGTEVSAEVAISPIPIPGTAVLLASGLIGLSVCSIRKRRIKTA